MRASFKPFLLLLFIFYSVSGDALSERPPIEMYGKLPFIDSASISPNGEHIAALINIDGVSRLAILNSDFKTIKTFDTSKDKPRGVHFINNEYVILHVSKTRTSSSFIGKLEVGFAYAINIKSGKRPVKLLDDVDDLHPNQAGLNYIVGKGRKKDHVSMAAYVGSLSSPALSLIEVNLKNGRGKVSSRGNPETASWYVDDRGLPLARVEYDNKKNFMSFQKYGKEGKDVFFSDTTEIPYNVVGVMPDESGLLLLDAGDNHEEIYKVGFDGEKWEQIFKIEGKEIEGFLHEQNGKIAGLQISGDKPTYLFLDQDLQDATEWMIEQFPNASLYYSGSTEDRSRLIYRIFDAGLGDAWVMQNRSKNTISLISSNRRGLRPEMVANVYSIKYKARDGLTIPAILTIPYGQDMSGNADRPLVVLPHGGPRAHDTMDFEWMAQFIASRGYVVLQPNFRGSTGYGQKFEDLGKGEWGLKMQDDVTDGVKRMAEADIAGENEVCIVGASYGGYAALAGGAFTPDLYDCVIAIAPVSDLPRMLLNVKQDYGKDHWLMSYWEELMGDGDSSRERLRKVSPVFFAEEFKAPVLLIHGNDDTVVPFSQSKVMARALNKAKKDVTVVKLKGEDHSLSKETTRMHTLREIEKFLDKHMPVKK